MTNAMTRKQFDVSITEMMTASIDAGLWDDGHLEKARLALCVRRMVANNPDLRECTPESIARAALDAHLAGLMPDGHEGYLVPRWNKNIRAKEAHFIASWRGLQSVACEDGGFRVVTSEVVREADIFHWTAGLAPTIEHTPELNGQSPIVAAYAVGFPADGSPPIFAVANLADLDAARETGGPVWKTHPAAMARKTAIRRLVDRVIHTPTARSRLAALTAADGRMDEVGTGEATGDRAARLTEALTSGAERVDEATGEVQEAQVEKSDPLADEFNKKHQALDEAQDYQGIAALGKQAEEAGLVWDKGEGGYRRAE